MKPITIIQAVVLVGLAVMGVQAQNSEKPQCLGADGTSVISCNLSDP